MFSEQVSFNFSGKRVLVTGATSGIGESVSRSFAESGANLVITGRDENRGNKVLGELHAQNADAWFVRGDVTNATFCEDLVDLAHERMGGLDVLVNCAGIIYHANALDTTDKQWRDTMDVNVNGVFYLCRAALRHMRQTGGVILNIASDAGLSASDELTAYNTSKAAVIQMSRSMARDFGPHNVRVLPICPGDVDTPMLRGEFEELGLSAEHGLRQSAEGVPLKRVCSSREVAALVLYAASDMAAFMSGYPLVLDAAHRA